MTESHKTYISLNSSDLRRLLSGEEIEVKSPAGNTVNILMSNERPEIYRRACNEALDKMEELLDAWCKQKQE